MIVPAETELTAPYWAAARRGEVLLQRCDRCGITWHPPAPVCPHCRTTAWRWEAAGGDAELVSWTRVHHAAHREVAVAVPYLVALVRLAEGPLFTCGLADPGDDTLLRDGAALRIGLGSAAGGLRLPTARCAPLDTRDAAARARRG